jgi:hypothetical protein
MDALNQLFGSPVRSRVLKLFFMNPDAQFTAGEAVGHIKVRPRQFLAEARRLVKAEILKSAKIRRVMMPQGRSAKRHKAKTVRAEVFFANKEFPLFPELRNLILKFAPHAKGQLADKIKRLGAIKLAVLAGVFIDDASSRADLLLVGDGIRKPRIKSFIEWLEAEVGKELNYVAMSSQEFKYRMEMYDRFVREILESPHITVINKLGL